MLPPLICVPFKKLKPDPVCESGKKEGSKKKRLMVLALAVGFCFLPGVGSIGGSQVNLQYSEGKEITKDEFTSAVGKK